jgi:hypothetical protein
MASKKDRIVGGFVLRLSGSEADLLEELARVEGKPVEDIASGVVREFLRGGGAIPSVRASRAPSKKSQT